MVVRELWLTLPGRKGNVINETRGTGPRFQPTTSRKSMNVLLTGATGFIGRHLLHALLGAGHEVVCAARTASAPAPGVRIVRADFTRDLDDTVWQPRLAGVEVVINAVGILREQGAQTFEALHERAPCALFAAASKLGVRLVIQVSALGADSAAASRYHVSKKRADDFLADLPLHSVIVQPSLVFGTDGASARLFALLASLPLIPLPGQGAQRIQPVHVDDVCAAVLRLIEQPLPGGTRLALVGPQALSLRDYLARLRHALGAGTAHFLPVPMPIVRAAARLGSALPGVMLDPETLQMLERGNTASAAPLHRLLGRPPRAPDDFIAGRNREALRTRARLDWLLPLLALSVAAVWIVTGIVSLGLYPVADSYALLARVGVTGVLAPVMLYGAAVLDILFGIGILMLRRRRWLWLAQLALILFYTVVITWRLPEFWFHPYGPLLKNLPMLAAIWLLYEFEER
jgi:uncharacterized protein YbjT (DUF2867 family)